MTTAAFATPEDLASFLQLPSIDRYTGELLIALAGDAIRDEIHQRVDLATTTEVYDGLPADHEWADTIFLREREVVAVTGIVDAGVSLAPVVDFTWTAQGAVVRNRAAFTALLGGILVTYTHGWASASREWQTCRGVAIQVAARTYVNPGQNERVIIGTVRRDFPRDQPLTGRLQLTEFEKRRLDFLRR